MTAFHRRPLELAAAAIDFDLSPRERAELDEHLSGCDSCSRLATGIGLDAATVAALPVDPVSPAVTARLRAATTTARRAPASGTLRLVAVAAVVALLALGALAVGAALLEPDAREVEVVPTSDPIRPVPSSVPSSVPSAAPPSASLSPAPTEAVAYEPPSPSCPAPPGEVPPPDLDAIVGDGEAFAPVVSVELMVTCSTVRPQDFVGTEPQAAVAARAGEPIRFFLEPGWHVLHWEASDRDRGEEAVNVIPGDTPDGRPTFLAIATPDRLGNVILGVTIWATTTDNRVQATVSASIWLEVAPEGPPGLRRIPADTACDSVAWPEGMTPYASITFDVDPNSAEAATAVSDTGSPILTLWPPAFRLGPSSERTILDEDGDVVVTDGQTVSLEGGAPPQLNGHELCVTPSTVHVLAAGNG